MKKKELPQYGHLWIGFLIIVASFIIMVVNFNYKEKLLEKELVEHSGIPQKTENICVCSACGEKGLAYCIHCGSPMNWDKLTQQFKCPQCLSVGLPQCPKCKQPMVGLVNAQKNPTTIIANAQPIPIY